MNLPDAIERVRRLRSEALIRSGKWTRLDGEVSEAHAMDARALAVCLEALAEHANDGGAQQREVNPKAYEPNPDEGRWTLEHAKEDAWRKHSTLKSAPPLTPEERMR